MPCVTALKADIERLAEAIEQDPGLMVSVDVENLEVRYANTAFKVSLPASAQKALLEGRWDPIADLLEAGDLIDQAAARLPKATRG